MTYSTKKTAYLRSNAKIWFALAIILSLLWIIMWATSQKTEQVAQNATKKTTQEARLPDKIDRLDDLKADVPLINFKTITRDLRSYPPEFKDKKFFEKQKGKLTIEVMDVEEQQLIKDFLDRRADRKDFAYFNYTDTNNKDRYVLTYGFYKETEVIAMSGQIKLFNDEFSKYPKPFLVKKEYVDLYLTRINNYELPTEAQDENKKSGKVDLKETNKVVAAAPAKAKPQEKLVEEVIAPEPEVKSETKPSQAKPVAEQPNNPADTSSNTNPPEPPKAKDDEPKATKSDGDLAVAPTAVPTADARPTSSTEPEASNNE